MEIEKQEPEIVQPISPEKKIERIKAEMTFQEKADFIPPQGLEFAMGNFKYKVTDVNPINLSFKAKLVDLPIIDENGYKHDIDGSVKKLERKQPALIVTQKPGLIGPDGKALKS
jgi:hypothetical protein